MGGGGVHVMTTSLISLTVSANCLELKLSEMRRCVINGISIRLGNPVSVCIRLRLSLYPTRCRITVRSREISTLRDHYHYAAWVTNIIIILFVVVFIGRHRTDSTGAHYTKVLLRLYESYRHAYYDQPESLIAQLTWYETFGTVSEYYLYTKLSEIRQSATMFLTDAEVW